MYEILRVATGVATPLALLGLVAALAFLAYTRRLKRDESVLESLPQEERANAADEYLTRYRIDGTDLTPADKLSLIRDEMAKRHQRALSYVGAAAVVTVVCFGLAVASYMYRPAARAAEVPAPPADDAPSPNAATETPPPEFIPSMEFPPDAVEAVDYDLSSTVDAEAGAEFLKLERVDVDTHGKIYRVTLTLRNIWDEPVVLDIRDAFFSMEDDTGAPGELIHAQYPAPFTVLAAGDTRTLVLYFRGDRWIGKRVSAHGIYFNVRGLTPVVRASWRIPVLVAAA